MPRSASTEPVKCSKRKGTRSVSTLTPTQLARKRANDREAQRAIRARTKEHIERLEQELESLKTAQGRDKVVQELLRRNRTLEDELNRLKETTGVSITSSPYSAPAVYDDNLSAGSGAIPSPRMSPLPSAGDYTCIPDYPQQFTTLPNNCEAWASTIPNAGMASNVSSPSSSSLNDEFGGQAYIPTSMPSSMMPNRNMGGLERKEVKLEYDELDNGAGFRLNDMSMQTMSPAYMQQQANHHQHQQQQQQQQQQSPQQQWNMYPNMYYPGQVSQRG